MARREAYVWDCVTLPDYRRQRLYSDLLSHVLSVLKREGAQKVWIGTSLKNKPSIKGFANAGAARKALVRPEERTLGPLVFGLSPSASFSGCVRA